MSPKPKAPTQKEIDRALDVFIRATAAGQSVNLHQMFAAAEAELEQKAKQSAPTQNEIERALDLLKRADPKDWPPTPEADRITAEWRKERAKYQALADQIHDEVYLSAYSQILTMLPESHKRLFQIYGPMVLASYAIDKNSYAFFRSVYLDAKKQLAALDKADKRSPRKAAKGGKNV